MQTKKLTSTKQDEATRKPRVTVSKTIRLTNAELEHAGKLLPQFPECVSEADLLRQAALIGLYVLAAQATGQPTYGGYRADTLVALLKYRLLPAIDFLFEHDAYPALYRLRAASNAVEEVPTAEGERPNTPIDTEAGAELGDLGIDFMEG